MNTNSDTEESLAEAIQTLAYQVKCLGLNGAATPMGATELLAMEIGDAGSKISWGLESVTRALEELREVLESGPQSNPGNPAAQKKESEI